MSLPRATLLRQSRVAKANTEEVTIIHDHDIMG